MNEETNNLEAIHFRNEANSDTKKKKTKDEHPAIEICRKSRKDKLDLCGSKLCSIPNGVLDLINLQYLYLENNQLSEIPTTLCDNLKLLIWFDVRRNNLINLPENINQLANLKHLLLEGNHIEELPVQLGQLINLKALNLRYNPLTFPPDDILAKGTREILKFLQKYEPKPEQVQNHFETELSEKVRFLSLLEDDTEQKIPRKRGSLIHRCPMVSFSRLSSSQFEENMLNLLEDSVSSLELKDRTEAYHRQSLPMVKPKSSRIDSNRSSLLKPMFAESDRKLCTKRESRIIRDLDRVSKRKLNEKTEKSVQAIKDRKSLDEWRKSKKSTDMQKEKNMKFEQKHEIVIPYGHDELTSVKKPAAPVVEKKPVPEQRLADINRLSLNEQLENRIKEHVQNIKNWRRNHSTDLLSLEKELSETTENLEKAEQLQKQLRTKHSKEYRFRAFTGGDYSYVPASYL